MFVILLEYCLFSVGKSSSFRILLVHSSLAPSMQLRLTCWCRPVHGVRSRCPRSSKNPRWGESRRCLTLLRVFRRLPRGDGNLGAGGCIFTRSEAYTLDRGFSSFRGNPMETFPRKLLRGAATAPSNDPQRTKESGTGS